MNEEKEFPQKGPNMQSSTIGYVVQARITGSKPVQFGEFIFNNEWQEIPFRESSYGVRSRHVYSSEFKHANCHSYEAAQVLRWWFVTEYTVEHAISFDLETRLVAREVKFQIESEDITALEIVRHGEIKEK